MYALLLIVVSALILYLLAQLNVLAALLCGMLALVAVPALIIHRREAATAPEMGDDAESMRHGWFRLAGVVGLDTTGIALGALLLILIVVAIHFLSGAHPHQ